MTTQTSCSLKQILEHNEAIKNQVNRKYDYKRKIDA